MKRVIYFVVTIADEFVKDAVYSMDVPVGNIIYETGLRIEYEQTQKDPLPEAYVALGKYMSETYPNMDYRIYYWTLEYV